MPIARFFRDLDEETVKRGRFSSMNTAMFFHRSPAVCLALAVCSLSAASPAFAEEDFSERWLERRELEMTRNLTAAIERDTSTFVSQKVGRQLVRADSLGNQSWTSPPAAPASSDLAARVATARSTHSRMSCRSDADGVFACVVHPTP